MIPPFETPDAGLADMAGMDAELAAPGPQMPAPARPDYNLKLAPAELRKLGRRLVRSIDRYTAETEQRRENLRTWRRDYEMLPADDGGGPWPDCSQLRAPNTRIACQNHTTRLNTQILGQDPPLGVVAKKPELVEYSPQVEEALTARLEEAGWQDLAREVHVDLPVATKCAVRITWETETVRRPTTKGEWDQDTFEALVESGVEADEAYVAAIATDDQGQAKVFLEFEDVPIKDGLCLRMVRFEDLVLCPATAKRPEDLWCIGERVVLRGAELQKGVREGKYLAGPVEDLLKLQGDAAWDTEEDQAEITGVDPGGMQDDDDPRYREYVCYELCWKDDLNDDGGEEWYWLTVHQETGTVVRAQYLPYEHGRPCYELIRYFKRPAQLMAGGVAESLAILQDAASALLNHYHDLCDLLVTGASSFLADPSSGIKPDRWQFRPGRVHLVENIHGIKEMTLPQGIPAALTSIHGALQLIKDYTDLLTASSNPALGRETDTEKTLGEVRLVLGQSMQIFEDYAAGVALDWARVWDQCRWLLAQYSQGGKVQYRRTAETGETLFNEIDASLLSSDFDLVPAGLNAFPDRQARYQRSMMIHQLLATNPLTMGLPDVQLETLDQVLQDVSFPGRQQLMAMIKNGVMMAMQTQLAAAQAGAQQEQMAGSQQAQMAAEDRDLDRMDRVAGIAEKTKSVEDKGKNGARR